jgi:hypothetical protein
MSVSGTVAANSHQMHQYRQQQQLRQAQMQQQQQQQIQMMQQAGAYNMGGVPMGGMGIPMNQMQQQQMAMMRSRMPVRGLPPAWNLAMGSRYADRYEQMQHSNPQAHVSRCPVIPETRHI